MQKPKRNYAFFENFARQIGMQPICRVVGEKDGDILIADSGKTVDGMYKTAFAIDRGDQSWLASVGETPFLDPQMTSRTPLGAQQYRINECLEAARKALRETAKAGLYRGDKGEDRIRKAG